MSKTAKNESDPLVQDAIKHGGWSVVADKSGKKYYQNKKLKQSTWDLKKDIESGKYPKYGDAAGGEAAATPAADAGGVDKVQEAMNEHNATGAVILGSAGVPINSASFMSAGQDKRIATLLQVNTDLQNEIESLKLEQDAIVMAISETNQKLQNLGSSTSKQEMTAKVVPSLTGDKANEKLLTEANEVRMDNWRIFSRLSELVTLLGQGLQETAASRAEGGSGLNNETRALKMPEGVSEPEASEAEKSSEKSDGAYGSELKGEAGAAVIDRFLNTAGKYQISPNSLTELLKYRDINLLGKDKAENPFGHGTGTGLSSYSTSGNTTGALERAIAASKLKQQSDPMGAGVPSGPWLGMGKAWSVAKCQSPPPNAADGFYRGTSPAATSFY